MTLLSRTAYASAHGVSRQAVHKWIARGIVILAGAVVDVEASDANMMSAGLGRFALSRQPSARQTTGGSTGRASPMIASAVAALAERLMRISIAEHLSWIEWPAIVAPQIAEDLGIPDQAANVRASLDRHVIEFLKSLRPVSVRPNESGADQT